MPDPRPLRWAVLGTGFISHTVIDSIAASAGSEVAAIVGRDPDRVAEFVERHGIPLGVTDRAEVLADPTVDVVYVGLPNHVHHDAVIAAAEAGKAVLCEKSLTTTMATAHELAVAVRAHGVFFVEGLMYLAHPVHRELVRILGDGRLGALRSVRASYAANIDHLVNPDGGGTIYNLGCYPVSLLHLVVQTLCGDDAFGDREATAVGNRSKVNGNVIETTLSLRFGNGVLASVQSSDCYGMDSEFVIGGENGTLRFVTNPWLPIAGPNLIEWRPFVGEPEAIVVDDGLDAFAHQVRLVERCVAERMVTAPRPSPRLRDSLEIMQLLTQWEAGCGA